MSETSDIEQGIAAELASNQRSISVAEFFEKNKHMLGFDSGARAMVTTVKEAVDNALDAAEEAEILPDVSVQIEENQEDYTVVIEDNGPGLPKENIPNVFGQLLYGSRFHANVQTRGQQGIGISAAVLYAQQTTGRPGRITSKTVSDDTAEYFEVRVDTETNEPEITTTQTVDWSEKEHGTRIELDIDANMRARQRLHDYIQSTAFVNPHARIVFDEPSFDEPRVCERAVYELPEETEEILPHPHGIELGTLQKMLDATDSYATKAFLRDEFTRVGNKTAENILDGFRDVYYGRELRWSVSEADYEEMENDVISVVSGKGAEATRAFAEEIRERVEENGAVTPDLARTFVREAAEVIEDSHEKRIGDTVREKTTGAVIQNLSKYQEPHVISLCREVTTDRKDDEAVTNVGKRVAARVSEEDDRLTRSEVETAVEEASSEVEETHDETFGETARENIADAVWDSMQTVTDDVPSVRNFADNRNMAEALERGMKMARVQSPPTKCLSPIGEDVTIAGLEKEFESAEFYAANTRSAEAYEGHPFVVEAGIAYGGDLSKDDTIQLNRFANRVPLVYKRGGCAITQEVKEIRWRNYKLSQSSGNLPQGPVVLAVHVASTNVPFTSESKDALASVPEIRYEIEQAVRGAARDLKDHIKTQKNLQKRQQKQNVVSELLPEIAEKAASVADEKTPDVTPSLSRIMNSVLLEVKRDDNGRYTIDVTNGTNSASAPVVEVHSETKPSYPHPSEEIEREKNDGTWTLRWNKQIERDGSSEVRFTVDSDTIDVTIVNMNDSEYLVQQNE